VCFTIDEGNALVDSLDARNDWEGAYKMRTAQWWMGQRHIANLDSIRKEENAKCDSTFNAGQDEQKELIYENDELQENARRVPWIVTLATLIGLLAGFVLAQ